MLRKRFLMCSVGFSLIETVVVITIVLIVAAITFPAYMSARKGAKISATISNLRQIHASALLYQADNGGGGNYGSLAVSGLPAVTDMISDPRLYELFRSPCGQHRSSNTDTATIYYPGIKVGLYDMEAELFKENLITVLDMMCSSPEIDLDEYEDVKIGYGILLSGQLVRRQAEGEYMEPDWWSLPMP